LCWKCSRHGSIHHIKTRSTLHHRGKGAFMIAGETIKLPSRMK